MMVMMVVIVVNCDVVGVCDDGDVDDTIIRMMVKLLLMSTLLMIIQ